MGHSFPNSRRAVRRLFTSTLEVLVVYLLSQLTGALVDLKTACVQRYTDGVMHAGKTILYVVHRLHQTRKPDHEMARKQWLAPGEQAMQAACRALAALERVRGTIGSAGLQYDTTWIGAVVHDTIRYLDWLMGPPDEGSWPAVLPTGPKTDPAMQAAVLSCECDPDRLKKPPVPNPAAN